jgi:glucose-6-phosphate isomerase
MSPTRFEQKLQPIELDLTAAFSFEHGFGRSQLVESGPQLETARQRLLSQAIVDGPQQLLNEYRRNRRESLLGQILGHAKRLRETVDTIVILGPSVLVTAASALLSACGHPQHNHLSRGGRGGRPRIYFVPAAPDNDSIQGLLDVLPRHRILEAIDERWGLLLLDGPNGGAKDDQGLLPGLFLLFWEALQSTSPASVERSLAIAVLPNDSPLRELVDGIEIPKVIFRDEPNSRDCITSAFMCPGVLLAGSVMGLDIVALVLGAAAMSQRFLRSPPGGNPPLDIAGVFRLLTVKRRIIGRRIDPNGEALKPLAQCFDQKRSPADELLIQWMPGSVRADRLRVTMPDGRDDVDRKRRKERYLTEIATDNTDRIRRSRSDAGQPTAVIRLPCINESSLGQLIQLHTIAASIEQILNP